MYFKSYPLFTDVINSDEFNFWKLLLLSLEINNYLELDSLDLKYFYSVEWQDSSTATRPCESESCLTCAGQGHGMDSTFLGKA